MNMGSRQIWGWLDGPRTDGEGPCVTLMSLAFILKTVGFH